MSRAHQTKAVVFDLDGTLFDSLPLVLRAFQHALEPFGGRPTMDTFAGLGGPPEKIFPLLISDPQHVPAAMLRLQQFHAGHQELIQPFPGAIALLDELQRREIKIALWTGRDRESTLPLLSMYDMMKYFSALVCGDDLSSHKPDPAGLRQILGTLAMPAEHVIFIGDADVDVLGGAQIGVDTLLITHGRELAETLRSKAVDIVRSPVEAYSWAIRRVTEGENGSKTKQHV